MSHSKDPDIDIYTMSSPGDTCDKDETMRIGYAFCGDGHSVGINFWINGDFAFSKTFSSSPSDWATQNPVTFKPSSYGIGNGQTYTFYATIVDTAPEGNGGSGRSQTLTLYTSSSGSGGGDEPEPEEEGSQDVSITLPSVSEYRTGQEYRFEVHTEPYDTWDDDYDGKITYGIQVRLSTESEWEDYVCETKVTGESPGRDGWYNIEFYVGGTFYIRGFSRRVTKTSGKDENEWHSSRSSITVVKVYNISLSDISGPDVFSPNENVRFDWTVNDDEDMEVTYCKIYLKTSDGDWGMVNNRYTYSYMYLAPESPIYDERYYFINNIYTDADLDTWATSGTFKLELYDIMDNLIDTKTKDYILVLAPNKSVYTDASLSLYSFSDQNKPYLLDAVTPDWNHNNVSFTLRYPNNKYGGGIITGFSIKIYSNDVYTSSYSMGGEHIWYTSTLDENGNHTRSGSWDYYTLSVNAYHDMMRNKLNYAVIKPFYEGPVSGNSYLYYGDALTIALVKPYTQLEKPFIAYPVGIGFNELSGSWHNNKFRILIQMPKDYDYNYWDIYDMQYDDNIKETYKYGDLELKVNGTTYRFSGTYTSATNLISSAYSSDIDKDNTDNHKRKFAINTALISGFPDVNEYRLSIRVQKYKYNFTDAEMRSSTVKTWSEWSDEVVIQKRNLTSLNVQRGDYIMASHYDSVMTDLKHCLNCYLLADADYRLEDQVRGDQIDGSNTNPEVGEYIALYNTIRNIINAVNSYCVYDRSNVKFPVLEAFSPNTELITASESTDNGKNYLKIMLRLMADYLK